MTHCITHACGHEQAHYIPGSAGQKAQKARWLATTKCRACFVADKKMEEARNAASDGAVIAHLDLAPLIGSERQIGWATTIRAKRLAGMAQAAGGDPDPACMAVGDARWWIDNRELSDADLLAEARAA
ncbi:hypothetical protein [uncultured Sphingomonas sp.]|uniref:hypothetical protein n=1 Tax=Sphingomonas sp. TaxID=28214 RepID=UPI002624C641|nr:hypothetical protein [uncultured Sphingomonas sp.]